MINSNGKKCRFTLIFPHNPSKISPQPYYVENLGIQYIASSLRSIGHKVQLINADASSENIKLIVDKILDFNTSVVGIAPCYTTMNTTLQIAKEAKKHGIFVCLGGHHATFFTHEILNGESSIDFVVRGEGELTIKKLASALEESFGNIPDINDLIKINGLSFRASEKIYHNESRELINDLDTIPFPARDFLSSLTPSKSHAMPLLSTSRGCPGNCSFCSTPGFYNRTWRARSASNVVDEIQEIISGTGCTQFYLTDDQFAGAGKRGRRHISDLIQEIKNRRIQQIHNLHFFLMLRADFFKKETEPIVSQFSSVGFSDVFIGFETGNSDELSLYQKGQTLKQYDDAISMCKKYNLFLEGGFILFNPFTTFETLKSDAKFIKKLGVPLFGYYTKELMVLPGTQLFKKLNDKHLLTNSSYKKITFKYQNPQIERFHRMLSSIFSEFENQENHFFLAIDFEIKLRHFIRNIHNRRLKERCYDFIASSKKVYHDICKINYEFFLCLLSVNTGEIDSYDSLTFEFKNKHKSITNEFIDEFQKINAILNIIKVC